MAPSAADTAAPAKPLSRRERRHGTKQRPAEEPTLQIPKGAIIATVTVLVIAIILGIKSSLQAASNSKPFSMEGFHKKKPADEDADGYPIEAHPRDTLEDDAPNGDWLLDPIMAKSMGISTCDIDRIHYLNMTTKRFARDYNLVKPVIIEGLVDDKWLAKSNGRWARPSLLSFFPNAAVHVSSGAGVVHSGGESLRTLTLEKFLEGLRENDGSGESATAFTFDLEFVEANKEIKQDYRVPTIFRGFNSHESMRRGTSWSILSLGASGAGLPFHAHGETWLGVVYGAKRWAIYPPTASRPYGAENKAGWHPLQGSLEWFRDVEPIIKSIGEVAPLQCMQNAGDMLYLPANWKHMTLNIGESIGVGGQAVYNGEARLRDGLQQLLMRPDDPDVLHSIGVGLAHRGIETLNYEGLDGKDKDNTEIDFERGMDKVRNNQYLTARQTLGLACDSLRKAIATRPGHPETHIILAEAMVKAGQADAAGKVIEDAWGRFSRESLPDDIPDSTLVTVLLNLARFFLQTEEGDKAEAYLTKGALAMQPNHGDGLADLAVALAMQGMDRMKEAMALIEKAEALGASGESFKRRREYVMRMVLKVSQEAGAAAAAAEATATTEAAEEETA